jgi:hypothetical protein
VPVSGSEQILFDVALIKVQTCIKFSTACYIRAFTTISIPTSKFFHFFGRLLISTIHPGN